MDILILFLIFGGKQSSVSPLSIVLAMWIIILISFSANSVCASYESFLNDLFSLHIRWYIFVSFNIL